MFRKIILTLWLAALLTTAVPTHNAAAQSGPAAEMIRLVNQLRAARGLPPFEVHAALTLAAQNQANWMAANAIYSHTGAGGSTPQTRAVAAGYTGYVSENIVGGTGLTPRQGVIWWENSPVHYNTMVSTRYVHVGIAYAPGSGQNFYAMVVGRPSDRALTPSQAADNSAAPIRVAPIQLSPPREDGSIVHVVKEGQALWSIAAYYEVELDYLYLINGLHESDFLQPGDEVFVRLAEGQEPPPTPTRPLTAVVRRGDTAWTIAARNGLDLYTFLYLNGMGENDFLQPGDEVLVRLAEGQPPPPTPTPQLSHIVKSGETLWAIASLHGLTMDQLMALNGFATAPLLHPGDELFIRQPDPTPRPELVEGSAPTSPATFTPASQATPTAEAVSVARAVPLDTPPPSLTAAPQAPSAQPSPGIDSPVSMATAVAGLLFVGLAVVVALIAWRRG